MTDPNSRYAPLQVRTWVRTDGKSVAYLERRFLPQIEPETVVAELPFEAGDRLDLLAQRALGDPNADWRLADAGEVMWPEELEVVGQRVKVALQKARG